jgi:hypothetical protein
LLLLGWFNVLLSVRITAEIVAKAAEISNAAADRILTAVNKGDIEELTAVAEDLKKRSDPYTPFSEKLA